MKILVLSDIHSNLIALETVLDNAPQFDALWCLGDVVGYGPNPNECIDLLNQYPNLVCLIGNHDAATVERIDLVPFNTEAAQVIKWTQNQLTDQSISFLNKLPEILVLNSITLSHGSPRYPIWEYILDSRTAQQNFEYFETPYCFVGHSHLPSIFQFRDERETADITIPKANTLFKLTQRSIVNPGSVGQPRDRDPRAAYAIYDPESETFTFYRVDYDIASVQERMRALHFPKRFIERLQTGY
jgi:predicted phosphodiesterase